MEQINLIEYLMAFGLTRQEAVIYLSLSGNGIQNGYEISKATGISRSNAYGGLSGLVEKGAAYVMEGKTKRYAPVEPEEFCANKIRSLEEKKVYLTEHMPRERKETDGYLTITGDEHIIDKIYHMLDQVQYRMYLSMAKVYLLPFLPKIRELAVQGKKVVILTDEAMEMEGIQVYQTQMKGSQIGIITDSSYVLIGELGNQKNSVCLYSGQKNFVKVFKDSLSNEIKLTELVKEKK